MQCEAQQIGRTRMKIDALARLRSKPIRPWNRVRNAAPNSFASELAEEVSEPRSMTAAGGRRAGGWPGQSRERDYPGFFLFSQTPGADIRPPWFEPGASLALARGASMAHSQQLTRYQGRAHHFMR